MNGMHKNFGGGGLREHKHTSHTIGHHEPPQPAPPPTKVVTLLFTWGRVIKVSVRTAIVIS